MNAPGATADAQPKGDRGIPSLDGIRAVSITIVVLSHCFTEKIPGGFGVTVFFFLSGFLITTLLRIEHQKYGHVSLRKFYLRRALRIFPSAYLVLVLTFGLAAIGLLWIFDPNGVGDHITKRAVLFHAFYLNNYYQTFFDNANAPHGTGVFWSLAVEEHFYLLFPAMFILLHKLVGTPRKRVSIMLVLCAVVLAWRWIVMHHFAAIFGISDPEISLSYAYRCTDTRLDSIMFGCMLALVGNPYLDGKWLSDKFWCYVATPLALLALLPTFLIRDEVFRQTFRYTMQSLALFPLFIAAVRNPRHPMFAWLNWPSVKFLGVLSYSLYLVHLVIAFNVARDLPALPHLLRGTLSVAISVALALVMYRLIEVPLAGVRRRIR
jgi:peptidoglycan/LPS O-acetylase OafA/YrhL